MMKEDGNVTVTCTTEVPENLKIDLNTPTDLWVVGTNGLIGASGLLTAIVVAWITRINQKSQNRVNKASFRQKWQEKFSDTSAKFMGLTYEITVESVLDAEDKSERRQLAVRRLPDLLLLRETLLIMLDQNQEYTAKVKEATSRAIDAIRVMDLKAVSEQQKILRDCFNKIHEKAWADIQADLKA